MKLLLLVLLGLACSSAGYRILVIVHVPSRSHANLGDGVVKALLAGGHEVVHVTPYPWKKAIAKLHQVDVSHLISIKDEFDVNTITSIAAVKKFSSDLIHSTLEHQAVRDALLDRRGYDAVITEWFFTDALAGISAVLKCPWVLLGSTVMHAHLESLINEVQSPAYNQGLMTGYQTPMSFRERVTNTLMLTAMMLSSTFIDQPQDAATYEKYFRPLAEARGVVLPEFQAALYNISALLVNSHPAIAPAQPLPPNTLYIGGFHIDPEVPVLPHDLQKILDESSHGVVYFSMGSILKPEQFPPDLLQQVLDVFRELKQTVLWKFPKVPDNLPSNVHVRPWMPQHSILAHPNVKVFITHGGLLSVMEAVHYGVPLVAVPIFGDQPMNADRAVRGGYALRVSLDESIGHQLSTALKEILGNPSYQHSAKSLSAMFRDRAVPPSKLLNHCVEMVIRSGGAPHLRSPALFVPFYQRYLLDQAAVLVLLILLLKWLVKAMINSFRGKQKMKTN